MSDKMYPNIDMEKTGKWLQLCMQMKGFSVKDIQEYLHLSCPQPVYRWFKGKILPSVDHLLMMSRLLGVHMEELLITKEDGSEQNEKETVSVFPLIDILQIPIDAIVCGNRALIAFNITFDTFEPRDRRLHVYYEKLNEMCVA